MQRELDAHNADLAIGESARREAAAETPRRLADSGARGHPMVSHRCLTVGIGATAAQKAGPGSSGEEELVVRAVRAVHNEALPP